MPIYILSKKYQTKWSITCDLCKRHYDILTSTLAFWTAHFCVHTCLQATLVFQKKKMQIKLIWPPKIIWKSSTLKPLSQIKSNLKKIFSRILCSESIYQYEIKCGWNGLWVVYFQYFVQQTCLLSKMVVITKNRFLAHLVFHI